MKNENIKHLIPTKLYLSHKYKKIFGKSINWEKPETYNEKLQWLKLYDRNPQYCNLVDKYEVKNIVASIIGWEYIIPTIGVWNSINDVDFSKLPEQFVIKCTHDSGSYVVCNNKSEFNLKDCAAKINKCLKHNFYWDSREWPYKNVRPRVIVEKYIGYYPQDYKFFVFNGVIDSIMVCEGRDKGYPNFYFYDTKWNRLRYQHENLEPCNQIEKPDNLSVMIELVKKLSYGFKHIRVDLYNVDGKVYFGEYTLYNQSGFDTDISYETDLRWGHLLKLKDE